MAKPGKKTKEESKHAAASSQKEIDTIIGGVKKFKTIWVGAPSEPFEDFFQQIKQLGNAGQYGVTYQCKCIAGDSKGQMFAVKFINKNRFYRISKDHRHKYLRAMSNEITILQTLKHPNIVSLHGVYEDKTTLYIVMEECKGGELFQRICERGKYRESDAAKVMKQLLEALKYMHEENDIVHCDLKPDNILFADKHEDALLKVIDFGMSKVLPRLKYLTHLCGTPYYTAPEIIRQKKYNHSCDLWSVGCILFVMIFGYPPFYVDPQQYGKKERKAIYQKIAKGFDPKVKKTEEVGYGPWFPDHIKSSKEVRHLIELLLQKQVRKRYTAAEALAHPWILAHTTNLKKTDENDDDDKKEGGQLDKLVMSRLVRFNNVCQFKLVITQLFRAQFYKMRPEHFKQLEEVFNKYDENGDGVLNFDEFEKALDSIKDINLEKKHIRHLYDQLSNEDKTNGIKFNDLVNALVHDYLVSCDERLYDAFRKLDEDNDGKITTEELKVKLKEMDVMGEWDRAIEIMKNECFNEDGVIDYEEFLLNLHPNFEESPEWMPQLFKEMKSVEYGKEKSKSHRSSKKDTKKRKKKKK